MAYLTDLLRNCCMGGCKEMAIVELWGWKNDSWGKYCARHGAERLEELREIEHKQDNFARAGFGLPPLVA